MFYIFRTRIGFSLCVVLLTAQNLYAQSAEFVTEATIDLGSEMTLHLEAQVFDGEAHQVRVEENIVVSIDTCPVFGTDGGVPTTLLKAATLTIKDNAVPLEVSCMYNPWVERPAEQRFEVIKTGSGVKVRGFFSDSAGYYAAEWLVVAGHAVRTLLTDDALLLYEYLDQ